MEQISNCCSAPINNGTCFDCKEPCEAVNLGLTPETAIQLVLANQPPDSFDYYKAPSEEIFQDIKQASIALWSTFDDTYKYATGKIDRIKDLQNISDNYGTMIAMFDRGNQNKLMGYFKRQDTLDLMITLRQWENSEIEKIINKDNKDNK